MAYVEVLFARRMFTWFASIVVVVGIVVAAAAASFPQNVHIQVNPQKPSVHDIPFGAIFSVAGYFTCVMTTLVVATLNRDREHLAYMWTRPASRLRIAFGYMLVDGITIVIAFVVVAVVTAGVMQNLPGVRLGPDPNALTGLVRYLALPLMWYGVVEAATSWNSLRGSAAAGIAWAVFWVLLIASAIRLPLPVSALLALLNIFNPLAYFATRHGESVLVDPITLSQVNGQHLIPIDYGAQTVLAYAIFIGGCIVAAYAWRRMEA